MANGKSGRKKKSDVHKIIETLLKVILILVIIWLIWSLKKNQVEEPPEGTTPTEAPPTEIVDVEGQLILTMIEVGQADSFLLEQDGMTALVDCGTRSSGKDVVEYLKSQGITKIDFVFGTHPHDDHMGGMYDVITNFDIGKIILPEVKANEVTANWYAKLMTEIKTGDYNLEFAKVGTIYYLGDASMKIIGSISAPNGNLNNYSTVMKVSFGEMDLIMTGDAETEVEEEILEKYQKELDAEILKMGHHGSDTSTSDEFLEAISPEYALISTKIGNKYSHPIKSTMQKLEKAGVEVYRTDENGTVEVIITSNDVTFSCKPGDYLSGTELEEKENAQ